MLQPSKMWRMETWDENNIENIEENITLIRTANDCIDDAINEPELKPLFGTLWQAGELSFLAGDTGKGKTILAVAIADALTKGNDKLLQQNIDYQGAVLYYDFELSDRQFRKRYQNYRFDGQFYRVVINPSYLGIELFSIDTIERDMEFTGAKIIIIDNITALALKSTQSQDEALSLMRGLKKLALKGISILVLAHTPKIAEGRKLSINHLAGSKHLSNFADSVFFIGQSNENPDYRYLKQVKCRNADQLHDVIVCELVNEKGYLSFEYVKHDREDGHIVISNPVAGIEITEEMEKAYEFHKQGKSLRAIAKELKVGKSTVDRWLKQRPLSQNRENGDFQGMGRQKNMAGQTNNGIGTDGTTINSGTEQGTKSNQTSQSNTKEKAPRPSFKEWERNERMVAINPKMELQSEHAGQDITDGTEGQERENSKGTTGQDNSSGIGRQEDRKRDLPPLSIEIVRNGKKITVFHPELKRIMHGDNWIDILYPEKAKPVYGAFDKDKVEKMNKVLRKWILKLLRFHKNGDNGIDISEFKNIVEDIKEIQATFDYKYLPKEYEYFDFIENLKGKLQRMLVTAKVENIKKIKPILDERYIEEMKQILYKMDK